jgi:hypothetical protein
MISEDRQTLASVGMVFVLGFAVMAGLIVAALFIA